jgi:AcrR family transcriptional regulator
MNEKPPDTKTRLLDAAERLFAERGFAAASLRAITAAAGVNLAAVNYHFRSKQALLEAVFARRLDWINRQRLELLAARQARARRRPPPLEDILEAFVGPAFRLRAELGATASSFQRLMGRLFIEPGENLQRILKEQFGGVAARFLPAFEKALPQLPPAELAARIHFMVGAIAHTLAGTNVMKVFLGDRCDVSDAETTIRRLVAFLAAGLRAPCAGRRARRSRS